MFNIDWRVCLDLNTTLMFELPANLPDVLTHPGHVGHHHQQAVPSPVPRRDCCCLLFPVWVDLQMRLVG